ncbi:thiamine phosphate synthase [Homoserinibacter sp. YIM 151385]|uniref:thiamine phosphate synthase n=1 Tax=Homoserinibacter sp. YIM 151385 TaxID=2985506 RepID=UPI0022F10F08|nr:thiamine phosphate synthase [Homoserinibacter sp. YIM 151385]WBU38813.1 thiamine phosphate synthase [Homoserinibacter sp. YIM 151385]
MSIDLSLYLVTDSRRAAAAGHDLLGLVREAAEGGVTVVQLREKDAPACVFLETVLRIADALPSEVALLVNDRVDVFLAARAAGARVAGVHVGQSDLPVEAVRELVGPHAVLGLSASTPEQLRLAAASPARVDYVGIGAVHATTTKEDAPEPLGLDRFARRVAASALPAVGIGGVTRADLPAMRAAGAAGAAVVSAICSAPDPRGAARGLREAWETAS